MKRATLIGWLSVLVAAAAGGWAIVGIYRHGKWEQNTARLKRLARIIAVHQPDSASQPSIAAALRAAGAPPDAAIDSWGRPFEIAVRLDRTGQFHYRLHSLGGDGRPGPCYLPRCSGANQDYNGDWLIINGHPATDPRSVW
jgi:hypothetical protein